MQGRFFSLTREGCSGHSDTIARPRTDSHDEARRCGRKFGVRRLKETQKRRFSHPLLAAAVEEGVEGRSRNLRVSVEGVCRA